jgi:histidinol-phosphatase
MAGDDLAGELALALDLADLADAQTLHRYEQRAFTIDHKADRSEVTEADREAETAIRTRVLADRPGHGLFGEEHGLIGPASSPWRWIVDPVDGTSNFVRGIPVWATLIALTYEDEVVVGVVSAPALGRRWWASRGGGAFVDGSPIHVSTVDSLDAAQVSVTFSSGWDELGLTPRLVELQQAAWRARGFGDFWQHMLVAEGAVEVGIDAIGVQTYDLAAVQIVVEEAGGTFTDRTGRRGYDGGSAVSSNGLLHATVLSRLT